MNFNFLYFQKFDRDKSETKNRRCKAVYSYTQNNNDELTLAVGDVIEFLGEVEEGWWRGKLSGKIGVFPSNFVEVYQSASPVFAKRTSNNNGTANNNNSRSGASLNSSREDLVSSNTSTSSEKDAPSLPPKPGIERGKTALVNRTIRNVSLFNLSINLTLKCQRSERERERE